MSSSSSGGVSGSTIVLVIAGLIVFWRTMGGFALWVTGGILVGAAVIFTISHSLRQVSTTTYSTTLTGDKKKHTKFHDTGKEITQISGTDLLGRRTTKTYLTRPGNRRPYVRHQTCNSCGASVASTDGSFRCSCGRRWGRR